MLLILVFIEDYETAENPVRFFEESLTRFRGNFEVFLLIEKTQEFR